MEAALQRSALKRRLVHTVVPHVRTLPLPIIRLLIVSSQRLGAPLGAAPSALPEFKDKESWYLQVSRLMCNFPHCWWSDYLLVRCRVSNVV